MVNCYRLGSVRNQIVGPRRVMTAHLLAAICLIGTGQAQTQALAQSQSQSTSASSPVFAYDVASIKLNKSGSYNVGIRSLDNGFVLTNITLREVIKRAYEIEDPEIVGAPDWIGSERYDIEAKMDDSVASALSKLDADNRRLTRQQMLQSLLADRFKLITHREARELRVFLLVSGKNGTTLQETKPVAIASGAAPLPATSGPSIRNSRNGTGPITLTVLRCTAENLASLLSTFAGRPVLDKTGLTSKYDFTLRFLPEDAPAAAAASDPSATNLFTAIQEQLGLKLEPGRGQVKVIVIDHLERPSEN